LIGSYRFLSVATARSVHFVDLCPDEAELRELADELRRLSITVVYVDCARFAGAARTTTAVNVTGATQPPSGADPGEPHWTRWWDDLLSLSHKSHGLAIVLDNAFVLLERDRKFVTDLIENFLQGATPWIRREIPCHLCLQMVACPVVAQVLRPRRADDAGTDA